MIDVYTNYMTRVYVQYLPDDKKVQIELSPTLTMMHMLAPLKENNPNAIVRLRVPRLSYVSVGEANESEWSELKKKLKENDVLIFEWIGNARENTCSYVHVDRNDDVVVWSR
jgi:hypothetical protein